MAPDSRIYLMRHGQAEHNVDRDFTSACSDIEIHSEPATHSLAELDDRLTPMGWREVQSFPSLIPSLQDKVDLIVTSPLRRATHTTLSGWKQAISRLGLSNVIVLPEAQECMDVPCDTGSSKENLEQDSDFTGLNLSRLTPDWTSKKGFYAPDSISLANRARWVRQFLRERPEKEIVLVCHGDFLRELTADAKGPSRHMWSNVEMRIYSFDPQTLGSECFFELEEAPEATRGYRPGKRQLDMSATPNGNL